MPSNFPYSLPPHKITYGVVVAVALLQVDPLAQRMLNDRRAKGIFANFVPEVGGSIVVSLRADGSYWIIDGQHRKRVYDLAGITHIVCEVHEGLSLQDGATLFLILNRESAKPNASDEYTVGLHAGLPLFTETEKALQTHGLKIDNAATGDKIAAVAGILKVTDLYGADTLDRALAVAEKAWGRSAKTWDGMLIGGLGKLLFSHPQVVDKELATKLSKYVPQAWIIKVNTLATQGGLQHSGTMGRVAAAYIIFAQEWNKGLRTVSKRIVL